MKLNLYTCGACAYNKGFNDALNQVSEKLNQEILMNPKDPDTAIIDKIKIEIIYEVRSKKNEWPIRKSRRHSEGGSGCT